MGNNMKEKNMKRIISTLLIALMIFAIGCENTPIFDTESALAEAERFFLEGNYEEVILTLETVIEVEPANARGYLRLSDAYIARGEREKALELLQQGLEITGDAEIAARIQGMTEVIGGIVDVAAGGAHIYGNNSNTLLLDAEGRAYRCGQQLIGYKFSNAGAAYEECAPFPTLIEGLPALQSISNNGGSFCGIAENGDLYVFGMGDFGWLAGDWNHEERKPIKIWEDVTQAHRLGLSVLALKTDGKLYARGHNDDGILGIGQPFAEGLEGDGTLHQNVDYSNNEDWLFVMEDVQDIAVGQLSRSIDGVSVRGNVCLAITKDDKLYGWGVFGKKEQEGKIYKDAYNRPQLLMENIRDAGVTGDGMLFYVTTEGVLEYILLSEALRNPHAVTISARGQDMVSISCGRKHICALDAEGVLYVSGSNEDGQLGIGQDEGDNSYETMVQPLGDTPVRQASAGYSHTCALLKDGRLLAWGNNEYGQLGNGRMGRQRTAFAPTHVLNNVSRIFARHNGDSAALSSDGVLYQAGAENGSIFTPVMDNISAYVSAYIKGLNSVIRTDGVWQRLDSKVVIAQNVASASVGTAIFYIDNEGRLWGKGNNFSGELGIGMRNDPQFAGEEGKKEDFVLIMEGVAKCISGSSFESSLIHGSTTIILRENGDVMLCGANPNTREFVLTPQKIASGMRDVDISSGGVYMIDQENNLHVWGHSPFSYIHDGSASHMADTPVKIYSNVQKIDADGLMLDTEGNVFTFGVKTFAEVLGEDTSEWSPSLGIPQDELICKQVSLPGPAKDIAASPSSGGPSYYAVLNNGELYAWGDNQNGQLGLGEAGSDETIFEVKLPEQVKTEEEA